MESDSSAVQTTNRNLVEVWWSRLQFSWQVLSCYVIIMFLAWLCIPGVKAGAGLLQHPNLERRSQSQPSETSSWYNCQYNDVCIVRPSLLLPRYYWHLEILSGSRSDIKTNVRQWLIYQHIAHSHLSPALPPEKCDVFPHLSPVTSVGMRQV